MAALGALWWVVAVAVFLASLAGTLLQPGLQRRRDSSAALPSVSLILPVKLVNPGFSRAQASAFAQDYPDYEVLVGTAESASPARDVMSRLSKDPRVAWRTVLSTGGGAVSPKLNTLRVPLAEARHDVVVTKDSNITFAPDSLRAMLRGLVPGVGLVCAVPVAVRATTLAGRIEAVLINRDARLLLTASASGKGYGVGKVMVFRRSDLARAGGVAALGYTIAEDTAMCRALAALGLATRFADTTVDQEIGARALRDVYARQARWAVIRRAEEPLTFRLRAARLRAARRGRRSTRGTAGGDRCELGRRGHAHRLVCSGSAGGGGQAVGAAAVDAGRHDRPGSRASRRLGDGLDNAGGHLGRRQAGRARRPAQAEPVGLLAQRRLVRRSAVPNTKSQ